MIPSLKHHTILLLNAVTLLQIGCIMPTIQRPKYMVQEQFHQTDLNGLIIQLNPFSNKYTTLKSAVFEFHNHSKDCLNKITYVNISTSNMNRILLPCNGRYTVFVRQPGFKKISFELVYNDSFKTKLELALEFDFKLLNELTEPTFARHNNAPNHSINTARFAGSDPTACGCWSGYVGR